MAKNAKTVAASPVLSYGEYSVNLSDLSPEIVAGLAGLGFSTKLKNVTAGLKPAIMGESKTANWESKDFAASAKEMGRAEPTESEIADKAWRESFATDYAAFIVKSEYEAILNGTASFGSARGPRLKGLDWYIAEVARGVWAKVKSKVPGWTKETDAEKFTAFVEKNRAKFVDEAQRRMDEATKTDGLELDL